MTPTVRTLVFALALALVAGCTAELGDSSASEATATQSLETGFRSTERVLVLNLDPVLENRGGRRVSQVYGYHAPRDLASQLVSAMPEVSHDAVRFEITEWRDLDEHHVRRDGFRFTDDSYARCVENRADCGGRPEEADTDYRALIDRHALCDAAIAQDLDEVWVFAGPYAGLYESAMAGEGSFWINGTADDTRCAKRFVIMWFNFERTLAEMLHNYGHRIESTMRHVMRRHPNDPFARFSAWEANAPGAGACGNVHFPPNGRSDYDYENRTPASSLCDRYTTYPVGAAPSRPIDCREWGCTHVGYMRWWLSRLPHAPGARDGVLSSFWGYSFGLEELDDRCTSLLGDAATCRASGCAMAPGGICVPNDGSAAARPGDVNGDGAADFVAFDPIARALRVYRGSAAGSFATTPTVSAAGMGSALRGRTGADFLGVADVDGDGLGDVFAAHDDGHGYLFRGRTDGTFAPPVASFAGTLDVSRAGSPGHEPIGLGDVNGDGRADLVTFYTRDGNIYVYSANAAGVFDRSEPSFGGTFQSSYAGGPGHYVIGVADLTGDGRADLVTARTDGNVYVYPGQPSGRFGDYVASFAGTYTLRGATFDGHEPVGLADVDGDGRADLVSAYRDGCVYTYPGRVDGRFADAARSCRPETSVDHELAAALDVDGDFRADLLSVSADGRVHVLRGQPDGSFAAAQTSGLTIPTSRRAADGAELVVEGRAARRAGTIRDAR